MHRERRAASRLALDGDEAVALADDAVHRREAEAGAFAELLGGEERLEQMRARLGRNADAVVDDAQAHEVAGGGRRGRLALRDGDRADLDADAAAARQRVARVQHQVQNHLLDLMRIDANPSWPVGDLAVQVSVMSSRMRRPSMLCRPLTV